MNISVSVECPSNIALIKYWGKYPVQIPANPSVSFSLRVCKTLTTLNYTPSENFSLTFYLDDEPQPHFEARLIKYFQTISPQFPFLTKGIFVIRSKNTFPHSSGIASSASGFGAIALAILELERKLSNHNNPIDLKKASYLARLGSGSAARSVYPGLVVWGKHELFPESSDEYAIPYPMPIHSDFKMFRDTILIIESGEKKVSSSVGHSLMENHPFAKQRFQQAYQNFFPLSEYVKSGDLESFGKLVEREALTLHAMMLTSMPYFILMKPNTLRVIEHIWEFREDTKLPVYFTLDAGANVHMLYPSRISEKVEYELLQKLLPFCQDGHYISDDCSF